MYEEIFSRAWDCVDRAGGASSGVAPQRLLCAPGDDVLFC